MVICNQLYLLAYIYNCVVVINFLINLMSEVVFFGVINALYTFADLFKRSLAIV